MDHEAFIAAVRKYPCLWNTSAIEYRDQELKDAAWTELASETDLSSVKEAKLRWKKLRDSYRDALKRQSEMMAKVGGEAKKTYHWKYMHQMQFLQPYMSNRKKMGVAENVGAMPARVPSVQSSSGSSTEGEPPPVQRRRKREWQRDPQDPLDMFFSGMCQSTKRLPFAAQLRVKRIVFEAVAAAEEALAAGQASSSSDDDDKGA